MMTAAMGYSPYNNPPPAAMQPPAVFPPFAGAQYPGQAAASPFPGYGAYPGMMGVPPVGGMMGTTPDLVNTSAVPPDVTVSFSTFYHIIYVFFMKF